MSELFARVRAYIDDDVEASDLPDRLRAAEAGDVSATDDLGDRFEGPLKFGTAGLRGLMGPGTARMNRATVLRATEGFVRYLMASIPDARQRGLVVGRDGRHRSDTFQQDVAAVAAAHGMRVFWLPGPTPTPLTAFAVRWLKAAGGVVVTASHNPPAYSGYKVFWENGAQIIPPHDRGIAAAIDDAPGARHVPQVTFQVGQGLVEDASRLADEYLEALDTLHFAPDVDVAGLKIAYTAMHGVGAALFEKALARRGAFSLFSVPEQSQPDGDFPTVSFPNPEEPGALDRVVALADEHRCDLVLAHDPDADRLGAAVRVDDRYEVLTGNEIGVLLGHHILEHTSGADRLVVTTLVSSRQLSHMAAARDVAAAETLTGFKWIANEALRLEAEGRRFVFGYEEALGYCCGTVVRDKDGIGAGLVLAEMAADYRRRGLTLIDALTEIRERFGTFVAESHSVTLAKEPDRIVAAMARLRAFSGSSFGDTVIERREDLAEATDVRRQSDVLLFEMAEGGRVAVRPSGTEPKIKFYLEVGQDGEVAAAVEKGRAKLRRLLTAVRREAGLPTDPGA